MKYQQICRGIFLQRPNRFIAEVAIDGQKHRVHVKNTGRCRELLMPGAMVYLADAGEHTGRKTRYDLIAVRKKTRQGELLINMDSQAPNKVVMEALQNRAGLLREFPQGFSLLRAEQTFGDSRFDLYGEGLGASGSGNGDEQGSCPKAFIEVKGVTLEERGIVRFPDAPTERGVKHVKELIRAKKEGFLAYIIFVIQLQQAEFFEPNDETHPEFGQALREAKEAGVSILAFDCTVEPDSLELRNPVPVTL